MADARWHGDMLEPSPNLPWYKGWAGERKKVEKLMVSFVKDC